MLSRIYYDHKDLSSLLNCALCSPSRLHTLPIINTHLTCFYPYQQVPYAPLSCLATNTFVSIGPLAEKFNIVSNDHGHTQRCEFSVLDRNHLFGANLAQKIKIGSLNCLVPRPIRIFRTEWWCSLFLF